MGNGTRWVTARANFFKFFFQFSIHRSTSRVVGKKCHRGVEFAVLKCALEMDSQGVQNPVTTALETTVVLSSVVATKYHILTIAWICLTRPDRNITMCCVEGIWVRSMTAMGARHVHNSFSVPTLRTS